MKGGVSYWKCLNSPKHFGWSNIYKEFSACESCGAAVEVAHVPDWVNEIKGRLGGEIGGPARAKKLSSTRRSEIASIAAKARWASYGGRP